MTQKTLPFKYEEAKKERGITSLGGMALYIGLAHIMELSRSVRDHIRVRQGPQGWTDSQVIISLILLNLAGGESLEQRVLPGMEEGMLFPFPTISIKDRRYKLFGIVTNRWIDGEEVLHWHRERCDLILSTSQPG
ncbi:MAG: hypothetical protein PHE86_06855 [Candidatus Marinimicrobia bacterium]|nr:hypothetical protein [Candidatus Neomarinimicrobiota bacterium]